MAGSDDEATAVIAAAERAVEKLAVGTVAAVTAAVRAAAKGVAEKLLVTDTHPPAGKIVPAGSTARTLQALVLSNDKNLIMRNSPHKMYQSHTRLALRHL